MVRTLLKEVKEYKFVSIITPLFMILEVLMEMLIPFLMASITKSFKNLSFLNPSLYCISVGMCSFILSHPFHIACSYLYYRDIFYQRKALLNYQSTFLVQNIFLFKIQI